MSQHSHFSPAELEAFSHSVDEDNFHKLQAAYDACLDEDGIKKLGVKPLAHALNETVYVFKKDEKHALSSTFLHLSNLGVTALFDIGTTADDKDPDTVIVAVSSPYRIGLPAKEYYEDEKVLKRYEEVLAQVATALSSDLDHVPDLSHDVVEFEKQLAAASPDAEDRDDVEVRLLSIVLIPSNIYPEILQSDVFGRCRQNYTTDTTSQDYLHPCTKRKDT